MQKTVEEQIARAKELLRVARHAAMATVNEDGTPHNTPFMFMHNDALDHMYWGSHPASVHSKNVLRTGQIFVVLYDAGERGGLYMKATDAHQLAGAELETALAIHNKLRVERGQDQLSLNYYTGDSPQRMWSAAIEQFWVNGTTRDKGGHIIRDIRAEIKASDLK
jgi:Pyridoxamine 5'-phosphate oxidase